MWWYRDLTFKIDTTIPFSKFWNNNELKNIIPKYIIPNCLKTNKDWTLTSLIDERTIEDSFNKFVFRDYWLWLLNTLDKNWFFNSSLINSKTIDTTKINWNKFNPYTKLSN